MSSNNLYEGCITETYFDEKLQCDVTLILDCTARLSDRKRKANERAVEKGFQDLTHFEGYLYANGLFNDMRDGYDVDVLNIHS